MAGDESDAVSYGLGYTGGPRGDPGRSAVPGISRGETFDMLAEQDT